MAVQPIPEGYNILAQDVPPEELAKRAEAFAAQMAGVVSS